MERSEEQTTVIVVQHSPNVPPGSLGQFLDEKQIPWRIVHLYAEGAVLPAQDSIAAVISLGGIMGAYDEAEYPWLIEEKRWLAALTRADVPILGICLGCQLLADALGGKAYPTPSGHELGFPAIAPTVNPAEDPLLNAVNANMEFVLCHGDTWDLPPGAQLLATSERCRQMFRLQNAWGVQFHPEATPPMFEEWLRAVRDSYIRRSRQPPLSDLEETQLNQRTAANASALQQRAYALFTAFFNTIPSLKHHVQQ